MNDELLNDVHFFVLELPEDLGRVSLNMMRGALLKKLRAHSSLSDRLAELESSLMLLTEQNAKMQREHAEFMSRAASTLVVDGLKVDPKSVAEALHGGDLLPEEAAPWLMKMFPQEFGRG